MSNKASSEGAAAILEPEVEEATVPVEDAGRETGQDPGGEAEGNLGGTDQTAPLPLHARVEALLLCSERPLTDQRLAELLGLVAPPPAEAAEAATADEAPPAGADGEAGAADGAEAPPRRRRRARPKAMQEAMEAIQAVREAVEELNRQYDASGRAFRVMAVAGGFQVLTLPAFAPVVARLKGSRLQGRLTPAALETLAIIAYRQPLLRADLESIRGVACGEVLRGLMERRLVRIVGRADEVGRPMLYGTTREFLKVFGLSRLEDLPQSKDLRT